MYVHASIDNLSYYEICWRCDTDEIDEERAIKNISYVL